MKSTFWKLAILASMALAFACSPLVSAAAAVHQTCRRAKDWLVDTISYGFKLAARTDENHPRMAVMLVQAKAFVMRLAKRERPELTGSWRMCPST